MSEMFYGALESMPTFDGWSVRVVKAANEAEAIEKFNSWLDDKHVCSMCKQKGFDDCKHITLFMLLKNFATEEEAVKAIDSLWPLNLNDPNSMRFPNGSAKFHEFKKIFS